MRPRNILRLAAVAALMLLPWQGRADDSPPDSKSGATPAINTTGKRPDQLFKELDKNGDGKLTAGEVPDESRSLFDHLLRAGDNDKNGELTEAEFIDGLKPAARRPAPGGDRPMFDPARQFQRWDRNNDGKLTLDELPEPARDRLKPLFDRLKKTEITREDFVRYRERRPEGAAMPRDGRGPAFLRLLDKNGDGRLSKDELQNAARILEELDTDKDGLLDLRELIGRSPESPEDRPSEKRPEPPPAEKAAAEGAGNAPVATSPAPIPTIAANARGKSGLAARKRFDANGDGKVSREEAQGRLRKHFDRIDLNSDGFLDRDELRQAMKETKADKPNKEPQA